MGWIARSQLASAVSEAGGLGIIETSSGELDAIREEIKLMREKTKKPFGVNIAQAFVRDPDIVNFIIDQGVKFVTTSAGDPNKYCSELKNVITVLEATSSSFISFTLRFIFCFFKPNEKRISFNLIFFFFLKKGFDILKV